MFNGKQVLFVNTEKLINSRAESFHIHTHDFFFFLLVIVRLSPGEITLHFLVLTFVVIIVRT